MRKFGALVAVVAGMVLSLSFVLTAQEGGGVTAKAGGGKTVSDREKAGLHGPVRSVEEERTYPAVTSSDGRVDPEFKSWIKTEYDREGRIAAMWGRDSSREHGLGAAIYVTRYTYNAAGQLMRRAREKGGEPDVDTVYSYDDQGRLKSITNSSDRGNAIAFRYDAEGRKSKIAVAKPVDAWEGEGAVSYSSNFLFEVESNAPPLRGGGSTLTLYDEHDRPTEVQTRNENGEIMYRNVRVYDEQGHVLEDKQTMDDVLRMIPAADQKKMMEEAGVTAQEFREKAAKEMREQIAQALGGSEMSSEKYSYDAQGRETLKVQKAMGQMEERVETSYNEHGDVAKETWQTTTRGTPEENGGTTTAERTYSYDYDGNGNWTLKKASMHRVPDGGVDESGDVVRRTIEYY